MKKKEKKKACTCPYCESELEMKCFEPAFCEPCNTKFMTCVKCGKIYSEKQKKCPHCT